jgi:hypothetical protein
MVLTHLAGEMRSVLAVYARPNTPNYPQLRNFYNIEMHAHSDSFPFIFGQSDRCELRENYDTSIIKRGKTFFCSPENQALPGGSLSGIIENKSYPLIR